MEKRNVSRKTVRHTNYAKAWNELEKLFKNTFNAFASGNPPESIKDLDINTVRTLYVFIRTIKSENTEEVRLLPSIR